MDELVRYLPELLGAAGSLWGWRQRVMRSRAEAARAAEAAAKAALVARLEQVSDMGQRFAIALGSALPDAEKVSILRALERERRAKGL